MTSSPLHIACTGFVDRDAGSVATANFLVLTELLHRGHTIDFYTFEGFVYPDELIAHPRFHYHTVSTDDEAGVNTWMPRPIRATADKIISDYFYYQHMKSIGRAVASRHERKPYDGFLFLGTAPQCETPSDLPVIAWVQGPPQTEWEAIQSLRPQIVSLCGWGLYVKLKAYYAFKKWTARRELARADRILCGSDWAKTQIERFGLPAGRVEAFPYPFDLETFQPTLPSLEQPYRLLWLGRIDPRKRLDLFLDAGRQLIEAGRDVHLDVVGRVSYADGYQSLLHDFPFPNRLTYRQNVDRADVPPLMQASALLAQPSMNENFGSSVAESLCCGRPVVLGPTNGTGEFAGEAAFFFDTYTPAAVRDAMANALDALAADPERLVDTARRTAEGAFSISTVVDRLERIVYDVTSPTSSRVSVPS